MDIYQELTEKGIVHESLWKMLFRDEFMRDIAFEDRTQTARTVCVFYATLAQAYVVTKCAKEGCSIENSKKFQSIAENIYDIWTGKRDFSNRGVAISFLACCAGLEGGILVKEEAKELFKTLTRNYERLESNSRITEPTTEKTFVKLFESLPLFAQTELRGNKLVFNVDGERIETKCSPYFFFYEETDGEIVESFTENCLVCTSVLQGDRDNELKFALMDVNELSVRQEPRYASVRLKGREDLYLACKAVGLQTQWYKEEYWCDFKYIKRLAESIHSAFSEILDSDDFDVKEQMLPFFEKTELASVVKQEKEILSDNIESFVYKLFITQGIFKTMRCLFTKPIGMEAKKNKNVDKLYAMIMTGLVSADKDWSFTWGDCEKAKAECEEQIALHEVKLRKVVVKDSKPYRLRMVEIVAEQRAITVLKSSGLKSDNIVQDEESLVAIDDYFDMLKNPDHSLTDNLESVLCRLICFYGALIKNSEGLNKEEYEFNEEKYYKDVKDLRVNLKQEMEIVRRQGSSNDVINELFKMLVEIGEKAKENVAVLKLIGRADIFDTRRLGKYNSRIRAAMEEETDARESGRPIISPTYGRRVFISYSRSNDDERSQNQISRFATNCKDSGIDVFFDKNDIKLNDEWKKLLEKTIVDPNCCCVCLFMSEESLASEYVAFEIQTAMKTARERFAINDKDGKELREWKEDRQRDFIVIVNLSSKDPETLYKDLKEKFSREGNVKALQNLVLFENLITHQCAKITDYAALEECFSKSAKWVNTETELDEAEKYRISKEYTELEKLIGKFYFYLKFGGAGRKVTLNTFEELETEFYNAERDTAKCIFPMVAAVKERRVKRDNISIIGYEIINGAGRENKKSNYILTSKKLDVDEYYCVPNYKTVGDRCEWMVEPLLVSYKKFSAACPEDV